MTLRQRLILVPTSRGRVVRSMRLEQRRDRGPRRRNGGRIEQGLGFPAPVRGRRRFGRAIVGEELDRAVGYGRGDGSFERVLRLSRDGIPNRVRRRRRPHDGLLDGRLVRERGRRRGRRPRGGRRGGGGEYRHRDRTGRRGDGSADTDQGQATAFGRGHVGQQMGRRGADRLHEAADHGRVGGVQRGRVLGQGREERDGVGGWHRGEERGFGREQAEQLVQERGRHGPGVGAQQRQQHGHVRRRRRGVGTLVVCRRARPDGGVGRSVVLPSGGGARLQNIENTRVSRPQLRFSVVVGCDRPAFRDRIYLVDRLLRSGLNPGCFSDTAAAKIVLSER